MKQWQKSRTRRTLETLVIGGVLFAATVVAGFRIYEMGSLKARLNSLPMVEYTVKEGDTVWTISERYIKNKDKYDKETLVERIRKYNGIEDPAKLQPGQSVYIPADSE